MTTDHVVRAETTCPDCERGWEHCHESLICHQDGTRECLEGPTCQSWPELHPWAISCSELAPGCLCSEREAELEAAA